MNRHSKVFNPIDQRKSNDIPAVSFVKRESLAKRVSKKMTRQSPHQNLLRYFDGAIDWCSLLLLVRRSLLVFSMAESYTSKKRKAKISVLLVFKRESYAHSSRSRSHKKSSGWSRMAELCWHFTSMERALAPSPRLINHALHHASRAYRKWKNTKERRQTVFTVLDPLGDEPDEEYEDLSEPRKVHCWINLRKAQD